MRYTILLLLIMTPLFLIADILRVSDFENGVTVLHSDTETTLLEMRLGTVETVPATINGAIWNQVMIPGESWLLEWGKPDVQKMTRALAIPDAARMNLRIVDTEFVEIPLAVAPSKGNLTRDIDPATVPYTFDPLYRRDAFWPRSEAVLGEPYILRDVRGIALSFQPLSYNPARGTLRVYTRIQVEAYTDGVDNRNVKIRHSSQISRDFLPIYQNRFVNWEQTRYTSIGEQGRLLVICYDSFQTAMQPFVTWKLQKGVPTTMVAVSAIGNTTTAIQNYITNYYNQDTGLTYVLFVGDAAQITTYNYGGGGSDPTYGMIEGTDSYPELFVGRFSAEDASQVTTQVNRTIYYEREITSGDWLARAMGIASSQGGSNGDDGESDIVHMNNIRTDLLGYGYTSVDQYYEPTATAALIANGVNAGRSMINYCGHGSVTNWTTTGFSNTHVGALTNSNLYPFIISVACVNGNFVSNTCFAEAWLRATSGGNPTGALAMYASSINQSWAPPMAAQDEVTDLLVAEQKTTMGGLCFNGSCRMLDDYPSEGIGMIKTWNIFGDPSVQVRSRIPQTMTISHPAAIMVGQSTFNVNTGTPGALVCLSNNGTIIGSAYAGADGSATLTLSPVPSSPGSMTLTITGFNKVTHIEAVPVQSIAGPYVVVAAQSVNAGTDGLIGSNENITINMTLRNDGTSVAANTIVTLSESNPYIALTDASETFGNITVGGSVARSAAFAFSTAANTPDNLPITFDVTIVSGTNTWTTILEYTTAALARIQTQPGSLTADLQPEQTGSAILTIQNNGGAPLVYSASYAYESGRDQFFAEGFETSFPPAGWSQQIVTGSGNWSGNTGYFHAGTTSAYANWQTVSDARLITNSMEIPPEASVSYWVYTRYNGYGGDFALEISTNGGSSWTTLESFSQDDLTVATWEQNTVSLAEYAGINAILAFRAYNNYDANGIYLDDVVLTGRSLDWLKLNGQSEITGSVSAYQSHQVSVTFDGTDLDEGVYSATISVESNDTTRPLTEIPVTMTISGGTVTGPRISVTGSPITIEVIQGEQSSTSFSIRNNGENPSYLTYTLSCETEESRANERDERTARRDIPANEWERLWGNALRSGWLSADPIAGVCAWNETDMITVSVDATGMLPGSHQGTVSVANNAGETILIPVTLTVTILSGSTPPQPVRSIAEFEPVEGALVRYPFGIPTTMIAEMAEDITVTTIVTGSSQESTVRGLYATAGVNLANCNFLYASSDSYWTRDYGPWYVATGEGEVEIVDFPYNRPRPNDDAIPASMAAFQGVGAYTMPVIHTGGNYMTDGMGVAASTDLVFTENPSSTQQQIRQSMQDYLGIDTYHVVADPNNTYIDHIDCWGKFLDVDKILIRQVPSTHAQYDEIEAVAVYFQSQTSSYGTPYQVYRVNTPNNEPYTNSIILNNKVFVPKMNNTTNDNAALAVYQTAMPGYEIIGFTAGTSAWESTDAIHCRIMGVADRNMIEFRHMPLSGTVNTSTGYAIEALIDPFGTAELLADSVRVIYKVGSGSWQSVTMAHINDNLWGGMIPAQTPGQTIRYYLRAVNGLGKVGRHPLIGAADPHLFTAGQMIGGLTEATLLSPAESAENVSQWSRLRWSYSGSQTPDGFKVHFGTTNPPALLTNVNNQTLSIDPGSLLPETIYYWQVVPYVGSVDAVGCPIWHFVTEETFETAGSVIPGQETLILDPPIVGEIDPLLVFEIPSNNQVATIRVTVGTSAPANLPNPDVAIDAWITIESDNEAIFPLNLDVTFNGYNFTGTSPGLAMLSQGEWTSAGIANIQLISTNPYRVIFTLSSPLVRDLVLPLAFSSGQGSMLGLDPPANIRASIVNGMFFMSWDSVPGADYYQIEGAMRMDEEFFEVEQTTDTQWSIEFPGDSTYFFRVRAVKQ